MIGLSSVPFRLAIAAAVVVVSSARAASVAGDAKPIVSDPVEDHQDWTIITKGAFSSAKEGGDLLPFEGVSYFDGRNSTDTQAPSTNRGAAKYFTGTHIEPGSYSVTFLVGKPAGFAFVNNLSVMLIADTNKDGVYTWSERVVAPAPESTKPAPADGEWANWTLVFKITPDTRTAGGFPVSGATLGLMFVSNTKINTAYALDYLRITRVP